jgi:hypothetical protein
MTFEFSQDISICRPTNLYKWARIWGKVQKSYYPHQVYLRREKQIEDFVRLNRFKNIYVEKDTDVLNDLATTDRMSLADIVVITDQKFSRMPCVGIIERIDQILDQCPNLFLCLNRHYINIDNSYLDPDLDDNLNIAITQWLKKNLVRHTVIDLSLDYLDRGDWFTWVIPDRMFYIRRT